jgi:hypothetical protein
MVRSTLKAIVLGVVVLCAVAAFANSATLLTFADIPDQQAVGNFYSSAYGITFANFYASHSILNGGSGDFSPTPLGTPAVFINTPNGLTGSPVTGVINVSGGFSSGVNFFFTAGFTGGQTETVTIWSGANGGGTVLATLTLSNNDASCTTIVYCNWSNVGLSFSGSTQAHSITFSGPGNELGISELTIGSSTTAIPEPSSVYLLGTGLAGMVLSNLRRFLRV